VNGNQACVLFCVCAAACGVDTQFNGLTVLSLFIGLLLGTGLGVVMAQVLPRKIASIASKPEVRPL
jgi:hypothetical protein